MASRRHIKALLAEREAFTRLAILDPALWDVERRCAEFGDRNRSGHRRMLWWYKRGDGGKRLVSRLAGWFRHDGDQRFVTCAAYDAVYQWCLSVLEDCIARRMVLDAIRLAEDAAERASA
jgi:hypothetical protein